MHRSSSSSSPVVIFLVCCVFVVGQSVEANTVSILETTGGHHSVVRKFVPEGSQVSLQCRVPANSQLSRMMDQVEPSLIPAVIWLRVDMNDPSNQEIISHGETLLIDTNPRLRLAYEEDTRTSTLTIDKAQMQDGGIFLCQVNIKDDIVPSSPIEVVIIDARSSSPPAGTAKATTAHYSWLLLLFVTLRVIGFSSHS